jgi:hypothetical protein
MLSEVFVALYQISSEHAARIGPPVNLYEWLAAYVAIYPLTQVSKVIDVKKVWR